MSVQLPDETLLRWIWLSLICSPGSTAADKLFGTFGHDVYPIYGAGEEEYRAIEGLAPALVPALCEKDLTPAKEILAWCKNEKVGILTPDHPMFPPRLKKIHASPVLLYVKGKLPEIEDNVCVAMVGTRSMTEYGQRAGYLLASELAAAGAIIVSGMAKGVDGIVHRAAIDAGGLTVAVLGCGIDRCYPSEHSGLRDEILRHGAVVTEYRPFTPPNGRNFPVRNRIISGLCQATVVVEGDEKSGAMITASRALEQGRDLYAMPGHVGEKTGAGPNGLLKEGARIATKASDILSEYAILYPHRIRLDRVSDKEIPAGPSRPAEKKSDPDRFSVDYDSHPISARRKRLRGEETAEERQTAIEETEKPEKILTPSVLLTEEEKAIWEELDEEIGVSADTIARKGHDVSQVLVVLTTLEIKGAAKSLPGGLYLKL